LSEHAFSPAFQHAVELVGRRWCGAIARELMAGPRRFSELERAIPDISPRLLTQRLRELEEEEIVRRLVAPGPPVQVRYELTDKGLDLGAAVAELERWAERWLAPAGD
jgi:DNA-binding HxlR family transcriptional regulator